LAVAGKSLADVAVQNGTSSLSVMDGFATLK
jgi:hypothetical protein